MDLNRQANKKRIIFENEFSDATSLSEDPLLLTCIQMSINALILFLIRPIMTSNQIWKTFWRIEQPNDRILLNILADFRIFVRRNLFIVHDYRIIDTNVTIGDAYGTNFI